MSLESCIRKAGKALTKEDATAIRALRDDLVKSNTPGDVNQKAVDEYLEILQGERDYIMGQVEALGATMADKSLSPSEFARKSAENLEAAARKFPRKGILRLPVETEVIDNKTGQRLQDTPENRKVAALNMSGRKVKLDPQQRAIDLLTERTYKSVELLYPDFYSLPPDQVLAIVNTFDPQAALGLAKQFGILPRSSRKLNPAMYDQKRLAEINQSRRIGTEAEWFNGWAGEVVADWIKKNETLPLYYKVEDPVARKLVDNNPDSPIAQYSKYGQVLEEAEAAQPVGIRKIMNWVIDKGSKGIEATLGAVPQSKLTDFITSGMESVTEYVKTVKRMDAWMNMVIEGHHAIAKSWLKFNRANPKIAKILGEFMHASTLAGVDVMTFKMPDAAEYKKMSKEKRAMWDKRASDYKVLLPFWERLGKSGERKQYQRFYYDHGSQQPKPIGNPVEVSEAQFIYLSVRDTYSMQRDMLIDNLEKRIEQTEADEAAKAALIAKLRKQFEAGQITPYFPLSRFGKHQAVAKTTDGEVVAFIKRENRRERNAWVDEMRARGFVVVKLEETASDLEAMNTIDPGFVASVTGMLDDSTVVKTETNAEGDVIETTTPGTKIQDAIWQMYLRTLPEMSARKAYIHRLGRLGFTHDALRSFSDHSFHSTHQIAKLRYGYELGEHLRNAGEEAEALSQRADKIKNMKATGWRPEGMKDASEHEVMMVSNIGGPEYRAAYAKFRSPDATGYDEEAHIKAREKILKAAEHDGPWAIPMAEELKRRHKYNMNPTSAAWSTKMTAFGFLWFLSTSPAAGVLNMTQTPISAYPILRAEFSGMGSGMELLKAAKDYASAPWLGATPSAVPRMTAKLKNDKDSDGKELSFGERAAMQEFDAIGIFSKTRTRELMGLSEAGSAYSQRQEQLLEMAGYIFHKTEEMNRAVTGLAAYRLARKKLANDKAYKNDQERHDKAVLMAEELIEMSHYDYTNTNRPRFMQGDLGRVVFLFRNYSLNMQYRLIRDFRDGIWSNKNISKEDRKKARTRFLGIIGMTTLFAGVSGYPLFWAAEAMANNLLGDDDDPFDSKTAMRKLLHDATEEYIAEGWGEAVATSVMKGPWSSFTGTDLSQRASLNNLWIREIPENIKDDPVDLMTHLSGEALGPIWGIGVNVATGMRDISSDHTQRGIEKLMPKFMGDIGKTLRYATQGAQTYQRDVILPPEAFTSADLFRQFSGFTPTRLSNRYEQNRAIKDMEFKLKSRRSDLMNQLFMAWRISDRKTAAQVMRKIAEWNKAQPRYPISPDNIRQSANSRAQYDMRTVGGVAVDKRLQYLHEELRFTDKAKR
jgi:hypothetical protein